MTVTPSPPDESAAPLPTSELVDLHCSAQTAALGEPPGGTAGNANRVVLVQLALPWPAKIDRHPMLAGLQPPKNGSGKVQVLGITTGDSGQASQCGHIICYSRIGELSSTGTTAFAGYERRELVVDPEQLLSSLQAIVDGDLTAMNLANDSVNSDSVVDVLVCTHGSRDRCCGQSGTLLFLELEDALSSGDISSSVRIWRTSHIGGHRFAPTVLTLPDGLAWSNLTAESLIGILDRSLPPAEAHQHLRGPIGFSDRPVQIVDGLGLINAGWSWFDEPRTALLTSESDATESEKTESDKSIVVTITSALGEIEAELHTDGEIPVPPCGETLEYSKKAVVQWAVVESRYRPALTAP